MGTRIVVMKDGVVQQIDTPANLYNNPCNQFVAGFIGSPQMNFIDVTLEKKEDGVYAVFGDNAVKIPDGRASKPEFNDYIGKQVVMGNRPEDVHDEEAFLAAYPDSTVSAYVEVTELMGAEVYLYLTIDGANFTARVNPRSTTKSAETIKVGCDTNRVHFFDKETELAILR